MAGQPTDLHLFADTDHFMFAETNTRVRHVLLDWLEKYFPIGLHRDRRVGKGATGTALCAVRISAVPTDATSPGAT
jgi:hypothetical protein